MRLEDDPRVVKLIQGEAEFADGVIETATKWVEEQPIEKLREIVRNNNWVAPISDWENAPEDKLREYMADFLHEDEGSVAEALLKNGIPLKIVGIDPED